MKAIILNAVSVIKSVLPNAPSNEGNMDIRPFQVYLKRMRCPTKKVLLTQVTAVSCFINGNLFIGNIHNL